MSKIGGWATVFLVLAVVCAACSIPVSAQPTVRAQPVPRATTTASQSRVMPLSSDDSSKFCPILQSPQVTDLNVHPIPDLNEPMPRVSFHEPVFGSCMARVSDHNSDLAPEDISQELRPEGASVQAFNADSSLILVRSGGWFWYIYSAENLNRVAILPFSGEIELRWDAYQANLLYGLQATELFSYDLLTGERKLVHDFALDFPQGSLAKVGTGHLGSPSSDARFWPLAAYNAQGQSLALMVYDQQNERISQLILLPAGTDVQGVALSPLGGYLVAWFAQSCEHENLASQQPVCGLVVFGPSAQKGRILLPESSSADTALDSTGHEVLVYHNLDLNSISFMNLRTGEETDLWLIDTHGSSLGLNISGRAGHLPGWALISTYRAGNEHTTWVDNTIFAIELSTEGRVLRLANTYSADLPGVSSEVEAGPQATANNDFTRVLFSSNWGHMEEGYLDIYMVGLPAGWPIMLP